MYKCFGTYYQWLLENDGTIKTGFKKVLADRYPDIMSQYRKEAAIRAMAAGHANISENDFSITQMYPPLMLNDDMWQQLCNYWDTPQWLKKSTIGKANRASGNSSGKVSRHTGGSMGFEEHRIILEKKLGKRLRYEHL